MPKGVDLTEEQKAEIQELYRDRIPAERIAKKLHLSKTTVHRVANNDPGRKKHRIVMHLTDKELADLIIKCGTDIVFKFSK